MPCRGPDPDPVREREESERRLTASLLIFLTEQLKETVKREWRLAIDDPQLYEDLTPVLCAQLKRLSARDMDRIVYNGRSAESRRLADWWERHQALDKEREREQAREAEAERLRKAGLAKLTAAEAKALGIDRK